MTPFDPHGMTPFDPHGASEGELPNSFQSIFRKDRITADHLPIATPCLNGLNSVKRIPVYAR